MGVNIPTIVYLRVFIIEIGSTIILMVVEAQGLHLPSKSTSTHLWTCFRHANLRRSTPKTKRPARPEDEKTTESFTRKNLLDLRKPILASLVDLLANKKIKNGVLLIQQKQEK